MKIFDFLNNKVFKIVVVCIVIIYVGVTIYSQNVAISEKRRILENYNEDIKTQKKIAQEIEEEKKKVGTDEYFEKLARDKLGMCKTNEKIFVDGKDN